jgi:hypothetical protein
MVVKGKALMGALTVLFGGLIGLVGGAQGMMDPQTWSYFTTTNWFVIVPIGIWLIFGLIAFIGGFLVLTGNSTGNTVAVFSGLISMLLFAFLLQPPINQITLSLTYYVKGAVGPVVYVMGGLFGLSIEE